MSILSTVKKGYMTIKTASGYVKLLPRTLATLVAMNDGKSVEEKINELNSKSTQTVTQTINGLSCTFYLTKIGKLVICNIIASGSLSTNDQGVNSVIPAAYRPAQSLFITAYNVTGTELSIDHGCTRYAFETTGRVTVTSNHKGVLERKAFGCWFTG